MFLNTVNYIKRILFYMHINFHCLGQFAQVCIRTGLAAEDGHFIPTFNYIPTIFSHLCTTFSFFTIYLLLLSNYFQHLPPTFSYTV